MISHRELKSSEAAADRAAVRAPYTKSKTLSVLHLGKFYAPHKGGMETHLQALCEELSREIKVKIIVASDDRKTVEERLDGVEITRLGNLFNLSSAPVCSGMVRAIRRTRADIIHIHFPNPTAILAYLASRHTGRLVITWHSDIVRQKLMGQAFHLFLKRALDRCHAIIATSPNYIDSSAVLSAYRDRCHVIPLGISPEAFEKRDHSFIRRIREQYGERIIFSVGRLIYYKGFDVLIRAMREIPKAHLLIAGVGPLRDNLESLARKTGVENRVTFMGEVEDVAPFYQAADVFALPSVARSEAFGIVQLEAMACGTPIVNTALPSGVPFVSPDGVTGLTVPPSDAAALATAINRLLDNPSLRAGYGRRARLRVRQEFDVETMTRRTLQLYQRVLSQNTL